MKNLTLFLIPLALVVGLSLTGVYANQGVPQSITQLDANFTGFAEFLTDLSNEVNFNMANITSIKTDISDLQGNATADETDIDTLQIDVDLAELDIANAKARLTALENKQFETGVDLELSANIKSGITVREPTILFYGDSLCKINRSPVFPSGSLYIQFGNTTTIQHLDDCILANGQLIDLKSGVDETFNQNDVLILNLILENSNLVWKEVYQEKN